MSDDGTTFTIDIPVTGGSQIDAAAKSTEVLAANLGDASKAIQAGEASYRKAEQSADRAAKALERVGLAADVQRGKLRAATEANDEGAAEKAAARLRDLIAEQDVLAQHATKTKTALDAEAKSLDKLSVATDTTTKAEEKSGKGAEEFFDKFDGLDRGLKKIGGPLANTAAAVADFGEGFGKLVKKMGPTAGIIAGTSAAVVALTAVVIGSVVAFAALTVQIATWAVGMADANSSAQLLAEGTARSVAGGEALYDKINELTSKLPLTQEELSATAQRLADAGLRGKALTDSLQTAAIAAAKLKFGPDFEKEMLSLGEQSKALKANIGNVFGGLKVEGLLGALQKLIGLFDESSASGHAIKVVFESIFQPLIDGLTNAEPKIEAFFLQLEIWALKALILFKPHASVVLKIGEAFAIVAGLVGGVLVAALGSLVVFLAAPFALLTALVLVAMKFGDAMIAAFNGIKTFLAGFNLVDMGKAMIDGLVAGITNGGAAVLSAMKGVVTGAVAAAEKALGIASPSKVFAEIGMQTGAGMSVGVNQSAPGVKNSLESMVSAPTSPASGKAAPATASAKSGGANISGNTFILNGVQNAEDAEARIGDLLTRLIEGDAAQLGAASPA